MAQTKLNKKRGYALVRGHAKARFAQNGRFFDFNGDFCGEVNPKFIPEKIKTESNKTADDEAVEGKEAVLARAAASLNLGPGSDDILRDAQRENAAALAAENNA